jgi:hypothetical protein
MRVPPDGWGGVEQVMYRQIEFLRSQKVFAIDLLNSKKHLAWIRVWRKRPTVVYLQYDRFAFRCRVYKFFLRVPVVGISHYGYADQELMWDFSYFKTVKNLLKLDKVICLNYRILEKFKEINSKASLDMLPNSIQVNNYRELPKEYDFLYLGKVEKRKRQFEVANRLPENCDISFIGPIADDRVNWLSPLKKNWFKGEYTQSRLNLEIPKYRVLILCSIGEGDAAVLYEAQAAGLSIVVSSSAIGAQDPKLPWIYLTELESDNFFSTLELAKSENSKLSDEIRTYAHENYDSNFWDKKLLQLLNDEID